MEDALRRQLAAAVGTSGMVFLGNVVHPANTVQLREVLAACSAAGVAVAPKGSQQAAGAHRGGRTPTTSTPSVSIPPLC